MNNNEIRIAITNMGAYNEGELRYEWLTLPFTDDELQDALKRIGIDGIEYEEYFISDYEAPFTVGEYDNIDDLNEKAESLAELYEDEAEIIECYIENVRDDFEEALDIVRDGEYMIFDDCRNMAEVAEHYLEETGMLHDMDDNLARYFNYEAFGRDMAIEGDFHEYQDGYIQFFN